MKSRLWYEKYTTNYKNIIVNNWLMDPTFIIGQNNGAGIVSYIFLALFGGWSQFGCKTIIGNWTITAEYTGSTHRANLTIETNSTYADCILIYV